MKKSICYSLLIPLVVASEAYIGQGVSYSLGVSTIAASQEVPGLKQEANQMDIRGYVVGGARYIFEDPQRPRLYGFGLDIGLNIAGDIGVTAGSMYKQKAHSSIVYPAFLAASLREIVENQGRSTLFCELALISELVQAHTLTETYWDNNLLLSLSTGLTFDLSIESALDFSIGFRLAQEGDFLDDHQNNPHYNQRRSNHFKQDHKYAQRSVNYDGLDDDAQFCIKVAWVYQPKEEDDLYSADEWLFENDAPEIA